jgi:hypothetical protein
MILGEARTEGPRAAAWAELAAEEAWLFNSVMQFEWKVSLIPFL